MGFRINTNTAALTAHTSAVMNNRNLDNSLSKLSSGLRINKAADDASGLAIANSLRSQASSLGQAINNGNDAIGLLQTADGALSEYSNILDTIKSKAVQAASDGQNTASRLAIQKDIDKLMEELNIIAKTTSFNGQKLLSGTFQNKEFQMGANANESVKVSIASAQTNAIGSTARSEVTLANDSGGEVALKVTSATTGKEIQLKTINVAFDNTLENSMGALADELNRYSGETGISAKAIVESASTASVSAGTTGANFAINGIAIGAVTVENNDNTSSLLNAINGKTTETGVTASLSSDGKLTLASDGRAIKVEGDIAGVIGASADQMSTVGKIEVVQTGSFAIQMEASGVKAVSANMELGTTSGDANMLAAQDSTLAAGSVIAAGSKLAEGTVVGGDTKMLSSTASTGTTANTLVKVGSTIKAGSTLEIGTQVGGSFQVGSTTLDAAGTTGRTDLTTDMLVTAGSTLKAGTQLGAGTVVQQNFAGYQAGDVLTSNVELTSDLVLTANMTLKDDGTAASDSKIAASSTINTGSILGADFRVGMIVDGTNVDLDTGGTATSAAYYVNAQTTFTHTTAATDTVTITAGSLLTNGSVLQLDNGGGAYTGPDLVTTTGVLKQGDTIADNLTVILSGDQYLDADLTLTASANSGTSVINAGSILNNGFNNVAAVTVTANTAKALDLNADMTVSTDMSLLAGSKIAGGSTLKAGSTLGSDEYVYGAGTNEEIVTTKETALKTGSILNARTAGVSMIASGSTLGGDIVIQNNETLTADMTLKAGSILKADSMLKAGTVLQQDMVLNTATGGGPATEVSLTAGTKLSQDLYVDADTSIIKDMVLKDASVIKADSTIARNASNAGAVDVSTAEFSTLADIDVTTLEGAMKAIDTLSAAITNLDTIRSDLGSVQNQVVSTINNISVTQVNVKAAESNIRDVDFAAESANFSKFNILAQSGSYAMSQANSVQQNVLKLLQ